MQINTVSTQSDVKDQASNFNENENSDEGQNLLMNYDSDLFTF